MWVTPRPVVAIGRLNHYEIRIVDISAPVAKYSWSVFDRTKLDKRGEGLHKVSHGYCDDLNEAKKRAVAVVRKDLEAWQETYKTMCDVTAFIQDHCMSFTESDEEDQTRDPGSQPPA